MKEKLITLALMWSIVIPSIWAILDKFGWWGLPLCLALTLTIKVDGYVRVVKRTLEGH